MKRLSRGLAVVLFALLMAFSASGTASAASLHTAGPYYSERDCKIARGEYDRYYEIESYCFQSPAFFGNWYFYYSK